LRIGQQQARLRIWARKFRPTNSRRISSDTCRWKPYVGRFGLLVLELHTLPPALTGANLERTPAVAYDATHGFSDQYLVELLVFDTCAREPGLRADPRCQAKFPPSDLATVSLNYFTAGA
jgi:hypothetical protein